MGLSYTLRRKLSPRLFFLKHFENKALGHLASAHVSPTVPYERDSAQPCVSYNYQFAALGLQPQMGALLASPRIFLCLLPLFPFPAFYLLYFFFPTVNSGWKCLFHLLFYLLFIFFPACSQHPNSPVRRFGESRAWMWRLGLPSLGTATRCTEQNQQKKQLARLQALL